MKSKAGRSVSEPEPSSRRALAPELMSSRTAAKARLGEDVGLSPERLLEMYRLIWLTRALDERMWILNRAGKVPFVISGQGHEGAQVGLFSDLRHGHDWMVPYYRSVAACLTFGMTPREIMLAQFARAIDPSSAGRQMPGHYGGAAQHHVPVVAGRDRCCMPSASPWRPRSAVPTRSP